MHSLTQESYSNKYDAFNDWLKLLIKKTTTNDNKHDQFTDHEQTLYST